MKLAVLIPDTHFPYHDVKAWKLFKKSLEILNKDNAANGGIHEIVFLGDFADFFAVSSHGTHPQVIPMLVDEVMAIKEEFDWFDETFPDAKKVFIEGNHENRLERYLVQKAPALFGVTETENVLTIRGRPNWKFVPYGPNQSYAICGSYLKARHQPIANNAGLTARRAMTSLVYGHIHRIESGYAVGLDGTQHVAFSVGWLGDKNKDKIFGYVKNHHDWQLGFGIVVVNEKTRHFYHQAIPIMDDYSCAINGKIIKL
jgi:hypothetical protein